jgi:proline dehydrogenase
MTMMYHLLIDAEDFSMQKAADDLIESMMVLYNKEKAIVWGTLQLYRHDRMDYLKGLHQRAIEQGFFHWNEIGSRCLYGNRT